MYVMSITEMGNGGRMENGSGDSCLSVLDDQEKGFLEGESMVVIKDEMEKNNGCFLDSSSGCSSIGKNSDEDIENEEDEEEEVQSSYYKCENGSFDSIQALEEALPLRRGMSRFYNGKSKSFTSLADASSSSSINEIVKPENPYSRRRRNLLACNLVSDKNKSFRLKSSGGVSKRSTKSPRTTLALAVAMTNSPKSSDMRENPDSKSTSFSRLSPHYSQLRQTKCNSSWRSFSFADLEQCASLKASAPL